MESPPSDRVRAVYARLLADPPLSGRFLDVDGGQVHVVEAGDGPPLVLLHGTGEAALFLKPLLERLDGVHVVAVDRPGHGLSAPREAPSGDYRAAVIAWLDGLLDALGLEAAALCGNSMGGLWSIWYALARPERVDALVLLSGAPGLPGARVPLPYRIMALPGVGRLVRRGSRPTPESVARFARLVGEADTIVDHPDLVDLLVAAGNDPVATATDLVEARTLVAPFAILAPTSFRRVIRVSFEDLARIAAPTLVVWGDREPVGSVAVAEEIAAAIPDAWLEVVPAGHGPWLGNAERIAERVGALIRQAGATHRDRARGGPRPVP